MLINSNMKQYKHSTNARNTQLAPSTNTNGPTLTEQQLLSIVTKLNSIVETQGRQLRRLENEIIVLREQSIRKSNQ